MPNVFSQAFKSEAIDHEHTSRVGIAHARANLPIKLIVQGLTSKERLSHTNSLHSFLARLECQSGAVHLLKRRIAGTPPSDFIKYPNRTVRMPENYIAEITSVR